jgi:SAM-dependent methyltransferase
MAMTPEMETLKSKLKAVWTSGDYGHFATFLEAPAIELFLPRLRIERGMTVLDVACGAGQIGIPAARAGATVTGVDIAANSIATARSRAAAEGLAARFEEGDAEDLRFDEASFDVVCSLFGAMFAPRPERVAAELVRVCKPGGRIVMGNWTPGGFIGQMFTISGKHVPPPAGMPSPMLWGNDAAVQQRLGDKVAGLSLTRRMYPLHFPFAPVQVVEFYREYYGPTHRAFASLDAGNQAALRADLERLWTDHNKATGGATLVESEYLEVEAVRA